MAKARTLVGLDVHGRKVVAAVLDAETGELAFFSMTADVAGVAGENDDLRWPHRDGLIWPHFSSVVVGLDVA